ncbi:G-alpha-domain-containing protein [Wolfiporia cocos MD-104 SS10]|uniref:G-alpha-domain-containing protein n=1 Tax=Wolfiporia cocos (strain MD-104) TaxID=742152 RepID=A0A2H3K949_WOLCO|nr:G-alpha-domain-containing protein [Wolfiporia cocos MD-104 SS10]
MPRWGKSSSQNTPDVWPPHPPSGESELERAMRLEEEREAKRVSDAIDHAIELERQELRKRHHHTRILLLGQAESGKSTMLKNFQLHFAPETFHAETEAWRAVIHLNLIRSVNFILDLLAGGSAGSIDFDASRRSLLFSDAPSTGSLRPLRMRLSPLRQVEMILVQRLSANDPSRGALNVEEATPWYYGRASEVSIRGGTGWKSLLRRRRDAPAIDPRRNDLETARQILHACRDDIVELWASTLVQDGLKNEGVSLQEQSGFFLDEAARVASADYTPTLKDILRARLQTIGVEEHTLTVEKPGESGQRWTFYDVGGARGQRACWVPYFDDVNAILFLCPMAAFNEVLLEDRSVNRLLDTFILWKTICSSKLLVNTTFILLLNKSDILKAKLESGVSFSRYVKSYKSEPNDFEHVSDYLRRKFIAMHKYHSFRQRPLHVHMLCAIDIHTTSVVITRIHDAIIMNNLIQSDYL